MIQALQNENTASGSTSSNLSKNEPSQWPVLGSSKSNSTSMNYILEDAVANINLHGTIIF